MQSTPGRRNGVETYALSPLFATPQHASLHFCLQLRAYSQGQEVCVAGGETNKGKMAQKMLRKS